MIAPSAWTEQALCAEIGNDDLWFPSKGGSVKVARSVCQRCAVAEECLRAALDAEANPAGVWAGTSWKQREQMRRERAA